MFEEYKNEKSAFYLNFILRYYDLKKKRKIPRVRFEPAPIKIADCQSRELPRDQQSSLIGCGLNGNIFFASFDPVAQRQMSQRAKTETGLDQDWVLTIIS